MAVVLAQSVGIGGPPTLSSASGGGDLVPTGENLSLIVVSGSTACTLTITTPGTVGPYGSAIADTAVVIPLNSGTVANGAPVVIPLPAAFYADVTGMAALSWSATTNVKFAVFAR